MYKTLVLVAAALAHLVEGVARTSPPSGAIVVAKSGGQYTTVSHANNIGTAWLMFAKATSSNQLDIYHFDRFSCYFYAARDL